MVTLRNLIGLAFAAAAAAVSTTGGRVLVLMDSVEEKDSYGQFFGDLTARGFDITFDTPRSEGLSLFRLGEKNYDHLLFFPVKVKGLGPNLTPKLLVDFVSARGNVLLALSSTTPASTSIVSFLSELDIALPAERTGTVVDHFHYDAASAADKHDVLVLDAPANVRPGLKPYFGLPGADAKLAFPRAVGHTLGAGPLLTPVVRAPRTAYSYNPREQGEALDADELFAAGEQLALVSVAQARNSARVAVLGSAEMLQDQWLGAEVEAAGGSAGKAKTENREFARRLSGWTFQEIGVLRVNDIEHGLVGSEEKNPGIYRIKTDVSYSISLSEYSWDKWIAFTLPENDSLQLEFSMLSPFHRLDLAPAHATADASVFTTTFTTPDQHGIFNFKVNYKRPFLSNVEEKNTVTVRHIAHDEWPRSWVISGAWPWISGIGATATGFVAFCAIWMFSKPVGSTAAAKKKKN
ncbi:Dolichyl-diphosphooligosaccharide--protein glycosyltransferase subunit wbp1 [Escovopsis weberi]|uniref:Dolichyl-diphosphooligosaccharide--protein glycosyltransferase subunit WBP1 n=1 Tax=Escovopsis weberi TaxID=150374 RepID=A0A0M9VRQ8_ESCWE|nr:Dolichyl-diphosphooligosaccharide--protein glycosyltransferase subunit wbp1 [Escovopsis weberi]